MVDRNEDEPPRAVRRVADEVGTTGLNQVAQQMRAASRQRLLQLAGTHPNETLTIIRSWMAQEHG